MNSHKFAHPLCIDTQTAYDIVILRRFKILKKTFLNKIYRRTIDICNKKNIIKSVL